MMDSLRTFEVGSSMIGGYSSWLILLGDPGEVVSLPIDESLEGLIVLTYRYPLVPCLQIPGAFC